MEGDRPVAASGARSSGAATIGASWGRDDRRELEGAFGRRALIERAKGILMEHHSINDAIAFEMLREQARTANRKLIDVASS